MDACSILNFEFSVGHQRIADKRFAVQVFFVHIHTDDAVIIVGFVIINPFVGIAARSVNGNFVFAVFQSATSSLLVNRPQNMKELADAGFFVIRGFGIHFDKRHPDKSGLRG